jgi:ribosomal protein S18 acetylase RimI-like enzyme
VRLAALKEAPFAFGSTYERELNAPEAVWRRGLQTRTRFVAEIDAQVVGTVSGGPGKGRGIAAVTAMWVDPKFRKQGIGDLLLTTVLEWMRSKKYREVFLWVTDGNDNAERLYVRHDFARTGESEEVRPGQVEFELSRKL